MKLTGNRRRTKSWLQLALCPCSPRGDQSFGIHIVHPFLPKESSPRQSEMEGSTKGTRKRRSNVEQHTRTDEIDNEYLVAVDDVYLAADFGFTISAFLLLGSRRDQTRASSTH